MKNTVIQNSNLHISPTVFTLMLTVEWVGSDPLSSRTVTRIWVLGTKPAHPSRPWLDGPPALRERRGWQVPTKPVAPPAPWRLQLSQQLPDVGSSPLYLSLPGAWWPTGLSSLGPSWRPPLSSCPWASPLTSLRGQQITCRCQAGLFGTLSVGRWRHYLYYLAVWLLWIFCRLDN